MCSYPLDTVFRSVKEAFRRLDEPNCFTVTSLQRIPDKFALEVWCALRHPISDNRPDFSTLFFLVHGDRNPGFWPVIWGDPALSLQDIFKYESGANTSVSILGRMLGHVVAIGGPTFRVSNVISWCLA